MQNMEKLVREVTEQIMAKVSGKVPYHQDICFTCPTKGQCIKVCPDRVSDVLTASPDRLGTSPSVGEPSRGLAHLIDHTLLKADTTFDQVQVLCAEAAKYNFKSVCVNTFWVSTCRDLLANYPVEICVVVGFPLGANLPEVKAYEAQRAVEEGATEVDMVINIGALKSGDYDAVERDIRGVVQAARGKVVKVILETCYLNDREKVIACQLSKNAGAGFVKTSTGFGGGGATAADVALMRRVVGESMGVKASGGVRDSEAVQLMTQAGATRIGASASVKIVST